MGRSIGRTRERYSPYSRSDETRRREKSSSSSSRRNTSSLRKQKEADLKKREIEEARRDDLTVLVLNLSLKADERHIYEFFSANAGKIRDIQLIRDQRSGISKGVAYTEFYTQEAVIKALALNGISFKGQPLKVQASMAEKNRAAKAAKVQQLSSSTQYFSTSNSSSNALLNQLSPDISALIDLHMRVYIGNLIGPLKRIKANDLRMLMSPFGEIIDVILPIDPETGFSFGYGFVIFSNVIEAYTCIQHMHKYKLLNQYELSVGYAADGVRGSQSQINPSSIVPVGTPQNNILPPQISHEARLAQQLAAKAANLKLLNPSDNPSELAAAQEILNNSQYLLNSSMENKQNNNDMSSQNQDGGINDEHDGFDDEGYIHGSKKQMLMQKLLNRNSSTATSGEPTPVLTTPPVTQTFLKGSTIATLGPGIITSCLCLSNMFNPGEIDLKSDPYFFQDISDDVKEECAKYGEVEQVRIRQSVIPGTLSIDPSQVDGCVFVKFKIPSMAQAAHTALNKRYFAGKQIHAEFVSEAVFKTIQTS